MTTRRAFFGLLAGFGLGASAQADLVSPKATRSLTLRVRNSQAVREALEQLGPAGRASFERLNAAVQSFGGSIDRMALRTMASASLPPEMAWSGSSSSAMTMIDSAVSSVSTPCTLRAPISVPHREASAAICCRSRVHSAIESSIGSVASPMLEGADSSRNESVGASIAPAGPVPTAAAIDGEGVPPLALPVTLSTEEAPALERRGINSSVGNKIGLSGALRHGHDHDGKPR